MKRIVRSTANKYEFDHSHEPVFSVKPGESFVVETEDPCNGCIRSADVLPLPENLPYKGKKAAFVRLEKPESIVSVYSFRPLEQAVECAILDLMSWIVEDYGLHGREAYMQACINPDFRVHVYQMVRLGRIQYAAGAEIPKKYLV